MYLSAEGVDVVGLSQSGGQRLPETQGAEPRVYVVGGTGITWEEEQSHD